MSSRDNILSKIKQNQPKLMPLPSLENLGHEEFDLVEKFSQVLESIGGKAVLVNDIEEIKKYIIDIYPINIEFYLT